MNATNDERSKSGPAFSLGKWTVLTLDILYKFLRLRFFVGSATPEDEDADEPLHMPSSESLTQVRLWMVWDKESRNIMNNRWKLTRVRRTLRSLLCLLRTYSVGGDLH